MRLLIILAAGPRLDWGFYRTAATLLLLLHSRVNVNICKYWNYINVILIQGSILDRNDDEYFVHFIEVTIYIGQYVYKVTVKKKGKWFCLYLFHFMCKYGAPAQDISYVYMYHRCRWWKHEKSINCKIPFTILFFFLNT